jgi:uncharacterized protein YuzE
MEEIAVENLLMALKDVRKSQVNDLHILYDEGADVMYVNFGPPVQADDTEIGEDDILYRYRNNKMIGLTVTQFSKR